LAAGSHRFAVIATDRAGNTGPAATRAWTIDFGEPAVRLLSGPRNGSISSDPSPSFAFTSSAAGSRFACRLDAGGFAPCTSPRRIGPLADGAHAFAVRAIGGGQKKGAPLVTRFTVDTAAPKLRIKGPTTVTTQKRTASAAYALVASERVGRRCRIASRRFQPCSSQYETPKLGDGTYALRVAATDRAGNLTVRRKRLRVVRVASEDDPPGAPGRRGAGSTPNGGVVAAD
jgi:hypothetical protein